MGPQSELVSFMCLYPSRLSSLTPCVGRWMLSFYILLIILGPSNLGVFLDVPISILSVLFSSIDREMETFVIKAQ